MIVTYNFIKVPKDETLLKKIWWRFLKGCPMMDGETCKKVFSQLSADDLEDSSIYYVDVKIN